ncbi:MAG: hypothetical protein WBZ36_24115 [Candidatus Nitrosopolaris sp.]
MAAITIGDLIPESKETVSRNTLTRLTSVKMLSTRSAKNEISITAHLEKFQTVLGATQTSMLAIMATIPDIAAEIKALP